MVFDISRNALDEALSPYLRQHSDNPINWQEWTQEAVDHAKATNKPLLVSVGYSTCHWCHVMAREAFSDKTIADFLNSNFVPIKVDREERPDIDSTMMSYCVKINGSGGWPLNVFLTPNLIPMHAMTYGPIEPKYGMPGFLYILHRIKSHYEQNDSPTNPPIIEFEEPKSTEESSIARQLKASYDKEYGGFGQANKFPSHSSNLFMLYYLEVNPNQDLEKMLVKNLDTMFLSGLHDHIQGGFYRYTVDRKWQIPHFEKMLYDQAMHLWVYSMAYGKFKNENYKMVVENLYRSLEETFSINGLYSSALDADTDHEEGLTYVMSYSELENSLTTDEMDLMAEVYEISEMGNFEGKIHLIRKTSEKLPGLIDLNQKLLDLRHKKPQPFRDEKTLVSWNSLAGIGLIHSFRYLGDKKYLNRALLILDTILDKHFSEDKLWRSYYEGKVHGGQYLHDHASFLLFLTYLYEEYQYPKDSNYSKFRGLLENSIASIEQFRIEKNDGWLESNSTDFHQVPAQSFDHPIPSSVSLARFSLARANALLDLDYLTDTEFASAHNYDFYNVASMFERGLFHIITNPKQLTWKELPMNSIQKLGKSTSDCYKGSCRPI